MTQIATRTVASKLANGHYIVETRKNGVLIAVPVDTATLGASFTEAGNQQVSAASGGTFEEYTITGNVTPP